MFDIKNIDVQGLVETHAIPWGINIVSALLIFIVGKIIVKFLVKLLGKILKRTELDNILIEFVQSIAKAIMLLFVIVGALDRLGVDTTSLIAVVGAAGLAIGLSLQSSLQNFASGFLLLVFRPFDAGDFVEAGGVSGVIETIGLFTTTLRTGDNKEVIVPNGNIYSGNIVNYSKRDTRRVDLVFGISYDDDIRKAKDILNSVVAANALVLKDPAPVIAVSELADSSVNFVVRPWCKTADYWDVHFSLTEAIKIAFDEGGISMPYPQMEVHLNQETSK